MTLAQALSALFLAMLAVGVTMALVVAGLALGDPYESDGDDDG